MNLSTFFDMTYGMFLLGSVKDGKPTGCIVNTAVQISNKPPLLSVSVSHNNYTNSVIKESGLASVNILAQGVSMDVIRTFGFQSGRDTDKFASVPYIQTADGLPVLEDGICGWFECKVRNTVELPEYTLFILEVFECDRLGDRVAPMTYAYYQMVKKGGVPKNAPAHTLPEEEGGRPAGPKYVCSVCGYEYDNYQGPFEFLPPDWKCPRCGAPKSAFVIKT
ncbi:High molecular weight rubredoxin [bioreactor metagenome]|uniref:High molecular weight rubredoxin n=1 Tax=bioreactor metagenome TaxID=1076179 RepID=A0A645CE31_9ZZZZ